ncbi:hypothetical protein ABEB36_005327 [Hypothenemus hampei]|uniref:Transmembrane protein 42 n=1 Tax=Hypothenemus hampei TaxID=57062 RepID=A0ABD1EXW3_HYPHA
MIYYAVFSGIFAASASAFGKFCGLEMFQNLYAVRLIFFVLMLFCNAAVWTMFVKALHQSSSSLVATVISSTSNYVLTAFIGFVLLGEVTSFFWWFGMLFIIAGLVLIVQEDKSETHKK